METLHNEIIENEVLAIVPTVDFIQMVYNFKQVSNCYHIYDCLSHCTPDSNKGIIYE